MKKRKNRKKISSYQFFQRFPNEESAREFFEKQVWSRTGRYCPHCGSVRTSETPSHKSMPYRCKDCRKHFRVKTNNVLAEGPIPLHKWLLAIFLITTNLRGVSSCKLARDLDVTQKTARFLAHRIWKSFKDQLKARIASPLEVDESYFGDKYHNMHVSKRPSHTGGTIGKTAVVAVKSRPTKKIKARVTKSISSITLERLVEGTAKRGSTVYTDQHRGYKKLKHKDYKHESANHGVGDYIKGQAHTNYVESFWSVLKRGYVEVYHKMSEKHLQRYVDEYVGRHNRRQEPTMNQISGAAKGMLGKRLSYKELTAGMSPENKWVI